MQLRPLPGTDGVLAIGAIRYMLETGAYDEERARVQIEGFDELAVETESFTDVYKRQQEGGEMRCLVSPMPAEIWSASTPASTSGLTSWSVSSSVMPPGSPWSALCR